MRKGLSEELTMKAIVHTLMLKTRKQVVKYNMWKKKSIGERFVNKEAKMSPLPITFVYFHLAVRSRDCPGSSDEPHGILGRKAGKEKLLG